MGKGVGFMVFGLGFRVQGLRFEAVHPRSMQHEISVRHHAAACTPGITESSQGGLVFKAHRLVCRSTLGSRAF